MLVTVNFTAPPDCMPTLGPERQSFPWKQVWSSLCSMANVPPVYVPEPLQAGTFESAFGPQQPLKTANATAEANRAGTGFCLMDVNMENQPRTASMVHQLCCDIPQFEKNRHEF
jgi:hypothetical protein